MTRNTKKVLQCPRACHINYYKETQTRITAMTTYNIHGTTDEVTICACCGKKNLRNTVVLEVAEGDNAGDILHFGSHCAARALGQRTNKADVIVKQAKVRQRIAPVVDFVRANIHRGIEAIKPEAQAIAKAIALPYGDKCIVSGFDSWGQINIHASGIDSVTVTA
jgi:hypothetical protein